MKLIERSYYLNKLQAVKDIPDIKVITGLRRSGKSKLLDAYANILERETTNNVIRIPLHFKKYEKLRNGNDLYEYIDSKYCDNSNNYLLIDEVQMCQDFEETINSLHEEERFDIYLTGSNAFLLSSDLATLFRGRIFQIDIYPFSFDEYLLYYPSSDIDNSFDKYVLEGGMAGSYLYKTIEDKRKYQLEIVRSTVVKDIVEKYRIKDEVLLNKIVDYLFDTVGERASIRNIANKLTSSTYKTNDKTVGSYLDYLCRCFLFYPMKRYDIKGKKYLESEMKYYLADTSFRFALLGSKDTDYGHLYENIVAIELLRRGYEVYIGQLYKKEIDFVAIKNGIKTYIQVSDDISRKETFDRELSPLLSINDAYPKMIIARTKHDETQSDGIRIIDIARWLLDK
ncbi:MAG: ATP-binding protein [Erysipelotrichaceae bacterium]|nr:ATP-binding protein [Erysipelotrichaceae bacterium]